tara:strand:+ start:2872 stop:3558 length:687 start_codon:yes stop_codon:yes gene_type:complete
MNDLVFDTSTIISIATNNLLEMLGQLKKNFKGSFIISKAVKEEVLDHPLKTRKYKLEAIRISDLIQNNVLKIYVNVNVERKTMSLLNICNNIFVAHGKSIKILDKAEVESLVLAQVLQGTYVVDERNIRLMVEDYRKLAKLLERKLNTKITINNQNIRQFKSEIKNINIIRSAELMTVAFEKGLFKEYENKYSSKKAILEGILWGLRLRGCAISTDEINEFVRIERVK